MTYLYVYYLSPTSSTLFTTVFLVPRTGPAHSGCLNNEFVKDTTWDIDLTPTHLHLGSLP